MERKTTFLKYSAGFPLLLALMLVLFGVSAHAQGYDLVVAKDGTGNYTTVQAAINAAPTGRTAVFTIFIKSGKYYEKVTVPNTKPFLQLIGESVANTFITFDAYSGKPMPGGGTYGTTTSATMLVSALDFSAFNLTFENTTGDSPQALAINVNVDRAAFKNCRFLGGQDTMLNNAAGVRNYFKDCYIDGTVDFIFGASRVFMEGCVIYAKTRRDGGNGGFITAANTPPGQAYGYVFRRCYLPANRGLTTYSLGRPWQNDSGSTPANRTNNKVAWISAVMGPNLINPAGWSTWDAGTNTSVITYAEYKSRNLSGNLVDVSQRVPWSIQLTDADTATYSRSAVLGTWDPCAAYPNFCVSQAPSIALANFLATKGTATTPSALTWNISWPITGVQYQILRSTTRKGTYTPLYTTTAPNATDVNFGTTDPIPAPGASYFYYVRAAKTGLATHISDTLQISSTPAITTTGAPQPFLQGGGQPSAAQRLLVTAENLTTAITVTPPAGYQVSTNGTTWFTSAAPLTIAQSSMGSVASTTLSVRLNASTVGTFAGSLTLASTGAATISLPLTGTAQAAALPQSLLLQWWPMARNNQDSAAVRAAALTASTPTFRKFVLSNGSATATIPPYSRTYGQAFSPSADGSWLAAVGGNGSVLSRTHYEQFTVGGAGTAAMRLDSVLLAAFVNGSTSNTKLAVVWSKSGFATDSDDVTGGQGPAGTFLSTANGGFTTPIFTSSSSSTYRLALAGAAGVALSAGQRLTFRVYFSCGSTSSATRFATLKNVQVKGEAGITTSTKAASASVLQAYPNPATDGLTVAHPAAGVGAEVAVYSLLGQRVAMVPCAVGSRATQLTLAGLRSGQYLLRYASGAEQFTTHITKQ